MATKHDLEYWLLEAIQILGGSTNHVRAAEVVWREHEEELRDSGDLFYTWQYDLRWAAQKLRHRGLLLPVSELPRGVWAIDPGRAPLT